MYVTIQWPCTYILPKPYSLKIFEYYIIALVLYTYIAHTALTRMPHDDIPRIRVFLPAEDLSRHMPRKTLLQKYMFYLNMLHTCRERDEFAHLFDGLSYASNRNMIYPSVRPSPDDEAHGDRPVGQHSTAACATVPIQWEMLLMRDCDSFSTACLMSVDVRTRTSTL